MIGTRLVETRAQFPDDRVSYSVLNALRTSVSDALYMKQVPKEPTPAMLFGKAVDELLFVPDSPLIKCHPTPASSRTKEFAEAAQKWATTPDAMYFDQQKFAEIEQCVSLVRDSYLWQRYADNEHTRSQVCGVLEMHVGGDNYQAVANVVDVINPVDGYILDLKITQDNRPHPFRLQVDRLGWDLQAISYVLMMQAVYQQEFEYLWLAVNSTMPHSVAIYSMSSKYLKWAEADFTRLVRDWFAWKDVPFTDSEALCVTDTPIEIDLAPWKDNG